MTNKTWQVINGNSAEVLKQYPDNYFDSVVTDPPYGINFLGKDWDKDTGEEEVYRQCFRVLKPGGHLLAFSAARTYHHLAMAVERAGFEIRDQIMWVYGSGFPKSQDVGKAIERRAGKDVNKQWNGNVYNTENKTVSFEVSGQRCNYCNKDKTYAKQCKDNRCDKGIYRADNAWSGWGTNLKPAHEPIVMARKPMKTSIIDNVQEWGTGALNIDACRVGDEVRTYDLTMVGGQHTVTGGGLNVKSGEVTVEGRFPANFIHDGSAEATAGLGEAQRYFYCAKVSRGERNVGCDDLNLADFTNKGNGLDRVCETWGVPQLKPHLCNCEVKSWVRPQKTGNNHPTVKPVALMRYLIQLVTPPNGHVLDPFNGSGSTGMAAVELGMNYTGIELDPNYVAIANKRIAAWHDKCNPTVENKTDLLLETGLFEYQE